MKKRIVFVILLMLSAPFAYSENSSSELLTLSECLKEAAVNNPDLKAAFEEWKAALEQIPQAKALEDPKFTFSYFIQEVETRVGPMNSKVTIMQTFPWFGEIQAKEGFASAKANTALQKYESAKLKLFYHVKKTFYEYSYLFTAIEIAQENLDLLGHFEEVARIKYKTSSTGHPDIIRAQVELAKLEDILTSLKELRTPISEELKSLLNRPLNSSLREPEKVSLVNIYLNRNNLIQLLMNSNPELAGLDWEIEAARKSIEIAKAKFYPNIGVGVDWTQIGPAINPAMPDSGQDAVALMFSVNIPLWHDKYNAGQRQAEAQLRKARQQKISKQNETIANAADVIYEIEDSQRKSRLFGHTLLSKAKELVQASEIAYKAGTVDFLSLIDAQRMLLQYRLNYERMLVNYQQKIAELEMLIGKELTADHPLFENTKEEDS